MDIDFQDNPIIFVVGYSRSGTTLMSQILSLNSKVFAFEELHFFEQMWLPDSDNSLTLEQAKAMLSRLIAIQDSDILSAKVSPEMIQKAECILENYKTKKYFSLTYPEIFRFFLYFTSKKNNRCIPCEQTPSNVLYIDEILKYFPNSRIINMVRDPRDVLLSQKNKWKIRFLGAKNIPYYESVRAWINYHPIIVSKLWVASVSQIFKKNTPHLVSVKYEDLVLNPEETVKSVCNFVNIEYSPSMLEVSQNVGGVSSHKKRADKVGIDSLSVGKWKSNLSKAEVFLCQFFTKKLMLHYGYQLEKSFSPYLVITLIYFIIVFPFKLILALLFNLHRMKNLAESLRRRF